MARVMQGLLVGANLKADEQILIVTINFTYYDR